MSAKKLATDDIINTGTDNINIIIPNTIPDTNTENSIK